LYVATEKNLDIINQLREKVQSGFQVLIPYIYTYKVNLNGSSQTVTRRFNRVHGIRLKKIYHSVFNNTETSATTYDNSNLSIFPKTQVFHTSLNDQKLQDYNLVVANYDDYVLLKDQLKNTVIQSSDMFYYNWVWIDNFSGFESCYGCDNLSSGLDLSINQKWDFYGVNMTNTNYNHYTFAVTEKMLTVSSAGITVI